jgi:hypothetical protein
MRLLILMLFASGLYGDVKLAGQITEDATYQPIPGATLQVFGPEGDNAAEHKVSTDSDGRFSINLPPGRYNMVAYATGYDAIRRANIGLNEGEQLRQINLALAGFASIEGRILDRSSKMPLKSASVRAVLLNYLRGRRQKWNVRNIALTGPSGDFRIEKLPAGEYLLEIQPEVQAEMGEDGRTIGYGRETWPGALPAASPFLVRGTDNLALGNVLVERTVLGVVTIALHGACVKDTIYNVSVYETDRSAKSQRGSVQASCNQHKKLTLSPGEYQIVAAPPMRSNGTQEAISGTPLGVAAFLHHQSDQQVNITLRPPILVSGVVSVEGNDSAPQWARPLPVHLIPIGESRERRVSAVSPLYNLPSWQDICVCMPSMRRSSNYNSRCCLRTEGVVLQRRSREPVLPLQWLLAVAAFGGHPVERSRFLSRHCA